MNDHLKKIFACIASAILLDVRSDGADRMLDYNRDIRPILSENCFACHGFDEKARQSDLRLDLAESAFQDRSGKVAIAPNDASKSELWRRINSVDADEVMPPAKSHSKLSDSDKATIKKWIEQGAAYAGHWAFIPPKKLELPSGDTKHPIDAFVDIRLEAQGLQRSPRADRATLIRRLSLDLTGLVPSAKEAREFATDDSPGAYERLVDRLLSSPHFGERVALEWLDSARYADTNGFSIDGGRHMWLWRDWVIQSLNDNKPYDQFLVEQIAGDLLPHSTESQKIATGFQRNNMVTHEGGTIPDENLVNYNADRVKTLGESVLGLTLGCAQCHDHKFDPIKQREYYQMFAFFNSLGDKGLDGNAGVNPGPSIQAHTVLKTEEVPQLREQISLCENKLEVVDSKLLETWERREQIKLAKRGQGFQVIPLQLKKVSTPNKGAGFEVDEAANRIRLENLGALGAIDVVSLLPDTVVPITGLRVTVHPVDDLPGGGWGYGPDDRIKKRPKYASASDSPEENPVKGTFMLTALALTADAVAGDQVNLFKLHPIESVTANSFELANRPSGCLDPRNESGWSPDPASTGPVRLTATFKEPLDSRKTPHLTVQLNFGHGRSLVPKSIELQAITGIDDDTELPANILSILQAPDGDRNPAQQRDLWKYCSENAPELHSTRIELANLRERLDVLTKPFTTMVMDVSAKPRETFVLLRGDYSKPGDKVLPGTLAALPAMPKESPSDRFGLARWIVMNENPLTARVAVNRFWKMLFGRGIVGTPADFGAQGEWPTHPELLDWLAVDFVEHGWNVKDLIRTIVLSETYRQSSHATKEAMERDPQNLLLARGARFRLPAELIRDNALKISGLLVPRIGGPSVNPYTPGDLWREVSHYGSSPATSQTFVQDHGEKLYRRSLYTYWKRTAPPPNMMAFDAPNREVCTVSRGNTTTPLQALVTLNDVQFVEAARAFGARMLKLNAEEQARLEWGFLEATGRTPREKERSLLASRLERERQHFRRNTPKASEYLSVGESPVERELDPVELAAWSQVASLLLNLSETLTRN
ncbi:MAG: PSD1 and planctomycete cytochrome C domain-containing protein [Pirellula sp.]